MRVGHPVGGIETLAHEKCGSRGASKNGCNFPLKFLEARGPETSDTGPHRGDP